MSSADALKFTVACPQCDKLVHATTNHIGKKGRCPACGTVFRIQLPDQAEQVVPSPDPLIAGGLAAAPELSAGLVSSSIWSEVGPKVPSLTVLQTGDYVSQPDGHIQAAPIPLANTSLADDYLHRARTTKTLTEEQEVDGWYRFTTSYGSMIGGALLVVFGLLVMLPLARLWTAATCVMTGGSLFVAGLNYASYYAWKKRQ
jgi:phage FluMu protein Com